MAALFDRLRTPKASPVSTGAGKPAQKQNAASGPLLALLILLLIIAALAALIGVPAYMLHQRYDEEIKRRSEFITKYQRKASERVELQEKLDAISALNSRRLYLKETTLALAQTEVQNIANNIITANNGRITSSTTIAPKNDGKHKLVIVQHQFYARILDIRKILIAIETTEPYLFIESITFRSLQQFNSKPVPGFEPEHLVTIDVAGYMVDPDAAKANGDAKGKDAKTPNGANAPATRTLSSKPETKVETKVESKAADSKALDTKPEAKKLDAKGVDTKAAKPDASRTSPDAAKSTPKDVSKDGAKDAVKKP